MKIFHVASVLLSILSFPIYAEINSTDQNKSPSISDTTQDIKKQVSDQAEAIQKVSNITIECEYDSMCLYNKTEELSKTDPNPVFKEFFKHLQENKATI